MIIKYEHNEDEDYAEKSAVCARSILEGILEFSTEEIELVYGDMYNHSNKTIRMILLTRFQNILIWNQDTLRLSMR